SSRWCVASWVRRCTSYVWGWGWRSSAARVPTRRRARADPRTSLQFEPDRRLVEAEPLGHGVGGLDAGRHREDAAHLGGVAGVEGAAVVPRLLGHAPAVA